MRDFSELSRAVAAGLQHETLGRPVFVRLHVAVDGDRDAVLGELTRAVALVRDWMGAPPAQVHVTAGRDVRIMTLVARFPGGETAVVSTVTPGLGGGAADLILLGSRGAMYYDGLGTVSLPGPQPPGAGGVDPDLRRVIEAALASGKPQPVTGK